jgi:hypothetical protein
MTEPTPEDAPDAADPPDAGNPADDLELPDAIDRRLWFVGERCGRRDYVYGNPHTFPGRIAAYCPHSDPRYRGYNISVDEMGERSPETALWIAGYLHGNEPSIEQYLGVDRVELAPDHPAWIRWQRELDRFHRTGLFPPLRRQPVRAPDGADLLPGVTPWTLVGGEVWRWDGERWSAADSMPELDGHLLAGTICAERGSHAMTAGMVCADCGSMP